MRTIDVVERYSDYLEDLSRNAAEPNPSYEPGALIPALRHFGAGSDIVIVVVFEGGMPGQGHPPDRRAVGLFPMRRRRYSRYLPFTMLEAWQYQDSLHSTPLLRRGSELPAVGAFFDWVRRDPLGAPVIGVGAYCEGSFMNALTDVTFTRGLPRHLDSAHRKPLAFRREDAETYLRQAFRGLHRKHFRRQQRRLAERGGLQFRMLADDGDIDAWLDAFIELERRGRKGTNGYAMVHRPDREAYFREVATNFWRSGRLAMTGMFLDGNPLSLNCSLTSGPGLFSWKVTYDEDYAAYSPGTLLEILGIESMHDDGSDSQWTDYCTWPDHPGWNRLALDRRTYSSELVSTGRRTSDLLIALLALHRFTTRRLRPALRFTAAQPAPG